MSPTSPQTSHISPLCFPVSTTNWHLPRAFTSHWTTTRAFATCLCHCSCWPSRLPKGIQGGVWGTLCSMETGGTGLSVSSVAQSCLTPCDLMDCSTPGFSVHLLELAQTHDHHVGDASQPSHPLSSPSPPVFNLSQGLFQWVSSSHQVAKVLELQLEHQSLQWILTSFRIDWLDLLQGTLESSATSQFKTISSLALNLLYGPIHIHTWLIEKL